MKLSEIVVPEGTVITEYSNEFADKILTEQAEGNWREIDGNSLEADLEQMIAEAHAHGKTSQH